MLLRELRVEQLRQFREPYVLDELSPGLVRGAEDGSA